VSKPIRPYVDRPVTDAVAASRLAAALAERLDLPDPILLRVGMNALFTSADVVIRVGCPSAEPDLGYALATRLSEAGIAVPQPATAEVVSAEAMSATAWQRIEPVADPIDWVRVGTMVRTVHALDRAVVPAGYPLPSPSGFPWWDFDAMLADVGPDIDEPALRGLRASIERHRGWDDFDQSAAVVCHGDVHPGNVLMTADGPVLLDWDLMCRAPAGWDHAMLLTLAERWGGDTAVYPAFADGYGADLRDDRAAQGLAELRNVAATLMRVRASRSNSAARPEADRRLEFWRGASDAPQWSAQ
jgi:hypothetical protein